jgi:dynein heavy chain
MGLPGSGRECLTKVASFISERSIFQIDIKQNYGFLEWREDMKRLLRCVAFDGKPTSFILKDSQVVEEIFLEDVNNLLNNGDIPNLYLL